MAPLTNASARIVDPVLTTYARGYVHPTRKGGVIAPYVECPKRGIKRIEFGKESFAHYETERAAGAEVKTIEVGYDAKTVSLSQHALGAKVPVEHMEEAADTPGIDLQMMGVSEVMDIIGLRLERAQAAVLTAPASYASGNTLALSGSSQWSDYAGSDPAADIAEATSQIRARTGMRPNTLLLAGGVYDVLRLHPKLLERFKYTSSSSITAAMMATYLDVARVEVADAVSMPTAAGGFVDVWGKNAILSYVAPDAGGRLMGRPSHAYTYRLKGHPLVEKAYYDPGKRSWINQTIDEWSVEVVGPDAGFLFQTAVA